MSQPCSAVELVLFDARGMENPETRDQIVTVATHGVLTGAVVNDKGVAYAVEAAGLSEQFAFWFGGDGAWPFERALAFANVEPQRVLFVSNDPFACQVATSLGLRLYDDRTTDITTLLP